jgi:hypothetical protein
MEDNEQICLTRLSITGLVDSNCPKCVLIEIAEAHNIPYTDFDFKPGNPLARFINHINIRKAGIVKKPYQLNELTHIAHFVNKNVKWSKIKVELAFDHLMSFSNYSRLLNPPEDFDAGPQTPDNLYNLNGCVLYGICRANSIRTHFDTTLDQMVSAIHLLLSSRHKSLYDQSVINRDICKNIYQLLRNNNSETSQLINIISILNPNGAKNIVLSNNLIPSNIEYKNDISYEELVRVCDIVKRDRSHNRILNKTPNCHIEAVVMAALDYMFDISDTYNPIAEYTALTQTPHFPYDSRLSERIMRSELNPDTCDNPHLNKVFNPKFPESMYTQDMILELCRLEGLKPSVSRIDNENTYSMLQMSYLSYTFIHGKHNEITNKVNTYQDEIDDFSNDEIVCYGIRINCTSLVAYTYTELSDTFQHHRRFQDPLSLSNQRFSDASVERLKMLCQRPKYFTESDNSYQERKKLYETIERVHLFHEMHDESIQRFIQKYDKLMEPLQLKVQTVLTKLLHLAMFMRGWKESGPYPLSSEETSHNNQPDVDKRVSYGIMEFENLCKSLPQMGSEICNLPLMIYDHGFVICTKVDEGLTIKDRIDIIKLGDTIMSMYSCIRLSSNRLASSAYYYMQMLNMPKPFNIERMSYIS